MTIDRKIGKTHLYWQKGFISWQVSVDWYINVEYGKKVPEFKEHERQYYTPYFLSRFLNIYTSNDEVGK